MGKIKDCKKYIGMTVLSALCFFLLAEMKHKHKIMIIFIM